MSKNIQGLEKFLKKIDNISKKDILKNNIEKACLMVEVDAKDACPVDDGILRASITHNLEVKSNNIIGEVGTNVEYGIWIEYGTGIFATEGTGRQTEWTYKDAEGKFHKTKGQKAQPFLEPSLDKNKDKIIDLFKNEIRRQIKK